MSAEPAQEPPAIRQGRNVLGQVDRQNKKAITRAQPTQADGWGATAMIRTRVAPSVAGAHEIGLAAEAAT